MVLPLLQAVAGHPEREALLDALVCNSGSAASKILMDHEDHAELLHDNFFTPFLCEAIHQEAWRLLEAFSEYGYGPETVLKTAPGEAGMRLGAVVAMSSVETIQGFRSSRFAKRWKPFEQGGTHCDATYGMAMGPDAAFQHWKNEILTEPVARRQRSVRYQVLVALHALATRGQTPEQRQTAAARWEALLVDWVPLKGDTPFHTAYEGFSPMRHVGPSNSVTGEKSLVMLLDWVRQRTSRPEEPVVETALLAKEWDELALAVHAGWPLKEGQLSHVARQLLSSLSQVHNEDWKGAWQALRAAMDALPPIEKEAAWAEIPVSCKDEGGRPLTARDLETMNAQNPQKRAAWECAIATDLTLPLAAASSGKRLRL